MLRHTQNALRSLIERYTTLSDREWNECTPLLQTRMLARNAHFVSIGRVPTQLGFVVTGTLRRYTCTDGDETVVSFLRPGSFASDYSALVLGAPATQGLQAIERSQLLTIDIDDLTRLGTRSDAWRTFSMNAAAHAVRRAEQRMTRRTSTPPGERLEELLAQWPDIFSTVRKHHVASYLGITPEHLSRLLGHRRREARAS